MGRTGREVQVEVQVANPVTLVLEGAERQRRVTVAFRLILAFPHFVYAGLVGVAAFFAVVAGWFAALFTARLPDGIATFVSRAVQYSTRVQAYAYMFLTDQYPPFDLGDDYPVSIEVSPGRLNRAAVLFRLVLMVPGYIVVWFLGTGYFVMSFFVWLITLMAGRLPNALFQANAAILRYQLRFYAFAAMLTSEYPRGLFGDRDESAAPPPVAPPPPPAPPPAVAAPPPPPPGERPTAAPVDAPPAHPRITRLVLSRAAKRIVALVLVLGAVVGIGSTVASAVTGIRSSETLDQLERNYDDLIVASQEYQADTQDCAVNQGGLPCLREANERAADAFARFGAQLRDQSFPAYSLGAAQRLEQATDRTEESLRALAASSTPEEYQARVPDFQQAAIDFDLAFSDLAFTLP